MDLSNFEILESGNHTFLIKEELDYNEFLNLQAELLENVRQDRSKAFHILCSHSPLFTYGRGLQRNTGADLEDFDPESYQGETPIFQIKRGGGLTFHHPGQLIYYSIINLNRKDWDLKYHYNFLMGCLKKTLHNIYPELNLECSTKLAGIWQDGKKVASIGVGVEHFVTTHGIALNLFMSENSRKVLSSYFPCGLNADTYSSVSDLLGDKVDFKSFLGKARVMLTLENDYLMN